MLDETDREIIKYLQADSRTTFTWLAKQLKITRNAVKYRIQKLESEGYIKKYTMIIDPEKFGKKLTAIFYLNVPVSKIRKCIKELEKFDFITNVYSTTGNYSIHAMGIFKSHDDLNKFISDNLSSMPIQEFMVTTVLKKYKDYFYELE
ncbi:MAG: Lrp/AsnC family transcriptional regulator [Thermoplasmata archaeon]|nr:MAG: Lrp/AsnC family transcriptional regulator [Thermoplasmata archaeon]